METIDPECVDNAIGMLADRFAMNVGQVGCCTVYACDGKTWVTNEAERLVYRVDDETLALCLKRAATAPKRKILEAQTRGENP